jgi:ankyrin repeat protein
MKKIVLSDLLKKKNPNSMLKKSIMRHDLRGCLNALSLGADINYLYNDNYTPLMTAIVIGARDCAYMLISKGANCDVLSSHNENSLFIAVSKGEFELAKLLLDSGASLCVNDLGFSVQGLCKFIDSKESLEFNELIGG